LKQIIILSIVGGIFIGAGYYFIGEKNFMKSTSICLILLGNIYGLCVLVLLLAYGIAFIPATTWKLTNIDMRLYNQLLEA